MTPQYGDRAGHREADEGPDGRAAASCRIVSPISDGDDGVDDGQACDDEVGRADEYAVWTK